MMSRVWYLILYCTFVPVNVSSALQSTSSLLVNTQWRLRLDVGMRPGSWMPKRFPGWGESGARLGLEIPIEFTDIPSSEREALVGPKESTFMLRLCRNDDDPPISFVSERGQEVVEFVSGGWCIQRPTGNVKNASGNLVKPEGLLRFWLDCTTGARRRDVEIKPNTRIFFTTGVWDDPDDLELQQVEYQRIEKEYHDLIDKTKKIKNKDSQSTNILQDLQEFQQMVGYAQTFDFVKARKEELERELPPKGASIAGNGAQMAPSGSLVIKGNSIPDWLPGSEYLILGTFSTTAVEQL